MASTTKLIQDIAQRLDRLEQAIGPDENRAIVRRRFLDALPASLKRSMLARAREKSPDPDGRTWSGYADLSADERVIYLQTMLSLTDVSELILPADTRKKLTATLEEIKAGLVPA